MKLQTLHACGVCVCGEPACKKEAVFYTETLAAASHYQLLMPFLDLKAGWAPSPECVRPFIFTRSGKCDLSCSFRGFLKLQQQTVMIFNVRNVIGSLSYVTVIPAKHESSVAPHHCCGKTIQNKHTQWNQRVYFLFPRRNGKLRKNRNELFTLTLQLPISFCMN